MNFGTLKSRIEAQIGRAPNDLVYELVTADINQEMRLHDMESTTTLVEGATVSLPADFLEVVALYRDADPRGVIKPLPPQTLHRTHQNSGVPCFYSIEDGQLRLSPSPSGSENLQLTYYAKLADLSADTDTNDVLTNYPSIYVYGVLAHHSALIRDDKATATFYGAYEKAKKQARAASNKYRAGGAPITPIARASA